MTAVSVWSGLAAVTNLSSASSQRTCSADKHQVRDVKKKQSTSSKYAWLYVGLSRVVVLGSVSITNSRSPMLPQQLQSPFDGDLLIWSSNFLLSWKQKAHSLDHTSQANSTNFSS